MLMANLDMDVAIKDLSIFSFVLEDASIFYLPLFLYLLFSFSLFSSLTKRQFWI